jgi:hypothetical protein
MRRITTLEPGKSLCRLRCGAVQALIRHRFGVPLAVRTTGT